VDLGLKGRTALVCGASAGLGRAIAEALTAEGARVAINSRSRDRLEAAADAIEASAGTRPFVAEGDLGDGETVRRVVAAAREALGPLDILVTNAGGPPAGLFEEHPHERWQQYIAQTLESVIHLVRETLPDMKARRWGRIVNVTSITVKQPVAGLIISNALRAGVTGFAKTISNEAAPFGVTVNNVLPGYTRTERIVGLADAAAERTGGTREDAYAAWIEQVPAGRMGEPEELAALTAFLCSEKAAYVTGQSIAVDGGWIKGLL